MKKLWKAESFAQLVDDKYRYYLQMQLACVVLGATGLLMSLMNVLTGKWEMTLITFAFFLVCFINLFLLRQYKHMSWVNSLIFEVSVSLICGYFLITGGADGFSPYWILILPFCVMPLLGRKRGGLLLLFMQVMIIFFLWTPWGRGLLTYPYSGTFCSRFPVVFLVSALFGLGFEASRYMVIRQMFANQEKVQLLSETDRLTGLKNRYWFQELLGKITREDKEENKCAAFLLMDIDAFKVINDTWGHQIGDRVLVEVAKTLKEAFRPEDLLCRWGGEEFLAYLPACTPQEAERAGNVICDLVRNVKVKNEEDEQIKVTISVGVVIVPYTVQVENSAAFIEADKQLYTAKRNGRNRISVKTLE